ncbi:MAG: type I restriction enzyme HsdR N-terminal domain-containing protein [Bacteroidota bacterium]
MAGAFPELTLPAAALQTRERDGGRDVLDSVRRRWVRLTPEEWVRQHLVAYLIGALAYPPGLLAIEREVRYLQAAHRADVLAVGRDHQPLLLAECKAASVPINQGVFDQAARYNSVVQAPYLVVTNGLDHYCCRVEVETQHYTFLDAIPAFDEATR